MHEKAYQKTAHEALQEVLDPKLLIITPFIHYDNIA
jgi:hypothetical protein